MENFYEKLRLSMAKDPKPMEYNCKVENGSIA